MIESDLETIEFDSGESDGSDQNVVNKDIDYCDMSQAQKDDHIFLLWFKLARKLKGAIYVI